MKRPRIAIVCDFLTTMGGAENVVLAMHEAFADQIGRASCRERV